MSTIPAEYVLSGDARQLLQTLSEVAAAFKKTEDGAKKAGDQIGDKLPEKQKKAITSGDRLKGLLRSMGGEAGASVGKFEQLTKATSGLSTETVAAGAAVAGAVAFVAALAAAYVALGAAIAKTVLSSAEWDQQLGSLSPLTDAQSKKVQAVADAYDKLGTQAKITGTKVGSAFADEVGAGVAVLNGIMARADQAATAMLGFADGVGSAATFLSYFTPAGNLAREVLQGLAEDGEQAQQALDMGKLGGSLKAMNDEAEKARQKRRDDSGKETGNLDGILAAEEAAQKGDERRKKATEDQTKAEHDAHAQYIDDLNTRRQEERQARSYEEQQEQGKLDAIDEESKKRADLQKKRLAYEKKIADEQKKNHADELARIQQTAQTILSLAGQIADLVNAIADAVGGEGKGSEKRKKWTQRLLGGLEVGAGIALSTVPGGAAVGAPLALSGASSIASSFPSGGIAYREAPGGMARTPDHFPVAVQSREAILNRAATEALGESGVDALNRGQFGGGAIEVAMSYRHRVFNRFISDHLRRSGALSKAITNSKRRGHARGR